MRKKKKSSETLIDAPQCDAANCMELGLHKAPKQKGGGGKNYYHFCLKHVQEFNKKYDFFAGMNEEKIIEFRHKAMIGHRPTWKSGETPDLRVAELENALKHFFDFTPVNSANLLPKQVQDSLTLFEISHPSTQKQIKTKYKILAKKYHPDVNKSSDASENFTKATKAYHILIDFYQ